MRDNFPLHADLASSQAIRRLIHVISRAVPPRRQRLVGAVVLLFSALLGPFAACGKCAEPDKIDRQALVRRHNPESRQVVDPLEPLTIGKGKFAFTADVTGLQSFPESYETGIPLSTQSQWGWHSFSNPQGYKLADAMRNYDTHGRQVPYASHQDSDVGKWLRANPHRLGLGRIGFEFAKSDGTPARQSDLKVIRQRLDLWSGELASRFLIDGEQVDVQTYCHPELDLIAVRVSSPLIAAGRLKVVFRFAYGLGEFGKAPEDWTKPAKHSTQLENISANRVRLKRTLDADKYDVDIQFTPGGQISEIAPHQFELAPAKEGKLEFVTSFAQKASDSELPNVYQAESKSGFHWTQFWKSGGAVELAGSRDPRANELEGRIVLSQYLLAVQCAGSSPPQETGLTFNSWFGKSHLEMHWWHAVHFALWNRLELLERSLGWYDQVWRRASETARLQGYKGVRWPKMVSPDGRESPSKVGVFLIWQQPHPIYYAELCYRQKPNLQTLEKYRSIVYGTADFMASYAHRDDTSKRFVLGPPLIPAQEHYDPRTTFNPTYELEYWHWALGIAREWRERLGEPPDADWDRVYAGISRLPITDGVYDTAEGMWVDTDHPSHLMAFGFLPGHLADAPVMRRTLDRVMREWQWDKTWGWDYPMTAMTAARVGEPETALAALLMDVPKNRYLANGHNHQDDRLPIYLPGNGGLLTAVAMMAAGWDGAPERHAPGFPDNGQWQVRWENLHRLP